MSWGRPFPSAAFGMLAACVCGAACSPTEGEGPPRVSVEQAASRCLPATPPSEPASHDGRIRPHPEYPCYWEFEGVPVLLLGASGEDNLFNHPDIAPDGLEAHLDLLVKSGGNYVRNTMSSRDPGNLWPHARTDDGRYDLAAGNPDYWERLDHFLKATHQRGIIVQIEVWDRFDFAQDPWNANPFNPRNNVNYDAEESGLPVVIDSHPGERENPFFRSIPALADDLELLSFQEAYVDRLLSITLEHPHVLYTISNETNDTPEWSEHWARHIRARAESAGVEVHVTEMWDAWDLSDPMHAATFEHPELYTFADISQNNHQIGQAHWDLAQAALHGPLAAPPRPVNSVKIYGGDRHGGGFEEGTRKLWRNIFGGLASSRFHRVSNPDNPSGLGLTPLAQTHLRSLRSLTDRMDVFRAVPRLDLLSLRDPDEAYAMADEGREYAVYFPDGGAVGLDLTMAPEQLSMRWLDILAGEWGDTTTLDGGGVVDLVPPDAGPWAVLIQDMDLSR